MDAAAAAMNEVKYARRSPVDVCSKPTENGSASRNPNSIWTPGSATRSSFRSSISSRSSRSSLLSASLTMSHGCRAHLRQHELGLLHLVVSGIDQDAAERRSTDGQERGVGRQCQV